MTYMKPPILVCIHQSKTPESCKRCLSNAKAKEDGLQTLREHFRRTIEDEKPERPSYG